MAQHTKACSSCPFNRKSEPVKHLGGSIPETYMGQVNGPFALPCHGCYDPTLPAELQDVANIGQCAGAAIFRTHVEPNFHSPGNLLLPADKERVFGSYAEFVAHHSGIPLADAEAYVKGLDLDQMTSNEMRGSKTRVFLKAK